MGNFFTIKPDGTSLTQVTHFVGTTISHKVGFSPDGKQIVFAKAAANGKNGIFTATLRGTALQRVTNNLQAADAVTIVGMLELNRWTLGLSYDITVSKLTQANNARGAFEISLNYVHPGERKSRVQCPNF